MLDHHVVAVVGQRAIDVINVVPLFGGLAGIIQSFLALQQRALQD